MDLPFVLLAGLVLLLAIHNVGLTLHVRREMARLQRLYFEAVCKYNQASALIQGRPLKLYEDPYSEGLYKEGSP